MTRKEAIIGLRLVADWLEDHPEITGLGVFDVDFQIPCTTKDDIATFARACPRTEKEPMCGYMAVRYYPMAGVRIWAAVDRKEVCNAVVTKKVLPAEPEKIIPALPEREVEVTEWDCSTPIMADTV